MTLRSDQAFLHSVDTLICIMLDNIGLLVCLEPWRSVIERDIAYWPFSMCCMCCCLFQCDIACSLLSQRRQSSAKQNLAKNLG